MRFCIPTTVPLNVESRKGPDGRLIYRLTGPATGSYTDFIGFLDRLYYNRSYYLTADVDECRIRLRNNESDVETSYFSYYKNLTHYKVPVPVMVSKTSIIAGFNTNLTEYDDEANLSSNFELFEVPVYLWTLFFISLLALLVFTKVLLYLKFNREVLRCHSGQERKLLRLSETSYVMKKMFQQVFNSFKGRSKIFRWMGFLFTLLCFFMIAAFLGVYSTSKIIIREPFIVKSYQELLETKSALPLFYDIVSKVSDQFENAPRGSLKWKVWQKLLKKSMNASNYIFSGENAKNPREVMLKVVDSIQRDNSVFIASSLVSNMLRTFGCGSSPDGSTGGHEEFWRLVVYADPTETEDIFGWALSDFYPHERQYVRKVTKLFYSGITVNFFIKQTDASSFASYLAGTSSTHHFKANQVCSDDYKTDTGQVFHAVTLTYYRLFMFIYICAFLLSSMILALEIACRRRVKKSRLHLFDDLM